MKKILLFLFLACFSFSIAQNVGDYKSVATGNWNSTGTWQVWNGSAWVAPATNNYPGNPGGKYAVTVSPSTVVTVDPNISALIGNLYINGTLKLVGTLTITGSAAPIPNLYITEGKVVFHKNQQLILPAGANIEITITDSDTQGLHVASDADCKGSAGLKIGNKFYSMCTGGGTAGTFDQVNNNSTNPTGIAVANADLIEVCLNESVQLIGSKIGNAPVTEVTWKRLSTPSNNTVTTLGTNGSTVPYTISSGALNEVGNYVFEFSFKVAGATVFRDEVTVTVKPLPTVSVSAFGNPQVCAGTDAVFTLIGTANSTVTYKLNNGANTTVVLSGSGTAQITVPAATTTQTLSIISVDNGSCVNFAGSSATIKVGVTTTYNGTWDNGFPDTNGMNVVIAQDYTTTNAAGSIYACSCTVNLGATLTISPNTYVEVLNEVTNNGILIVESDGNLKQINNVANSGNIKVRRTHTLTDLRKEYNFLSSPVANQNMKMIYGNNAENVPFVTVLRESTNSFVNATAADYAIQGKGFSVKEPKKIGYDDLSGDNLPENVAQYQGVPNNGDITLAFPTYTAGRGYNLAGNPYPSNLDIIDLYNDPETQNINPEFRFWDNSVNDIYTQMGGAYQGYSYAIFNAATDTDGIGLPAPGRGGVENGVPYPAGSKPPGRVIKVSQGFMVRATGAGGQLAFKNSMRRTSNDYTEFFGKTSPKNRYRLQLVKSNGFTVQNAIAYFATGNQNLGLEDTRIPNASASDALFTYAGDSKVVINGRSAFAPDDVLTLGTRHFTAGTYTLQAVDEEGVFAKGQSIYLKDKKLGIITDLTKGDYIFTSDSGEYTNRFEIVYTPALVLATDTVVKSKLEVYRDATDFVIRSSDKAIETMELYDASGRLVLSQKGNGNGKELRFSATRLSEGMYLVKALLKDGQELTKKIRK